MQNSNDMIINKDESGGSGNEDDTGCMAIFVADKGESESLDNGQPAAGIIKSEEACSCRWRLSMPGTWWEALSHMPCCAYRTCIGMSDWKGDLGLRLAYESFG